MKTTKSDGKTKSQFCIFVTLLPFLEALSSNNILLYWVEETKKELGSGCFTGWGNAGYVSQISIHNVKVSWDHLLILCCAQKLLCLPEFIAFRLSLHFSGYLEAAMQSHPPFSCKTDPRTLRERAAAFLLNCNWTELKIEAELKLKRIQNPHRAPTRSGAASKRQRDLQTQAGCHHGCVGHDSRRTAHGGWGRWS